VADWIRKATSMTGGVLVAAVRKVLVAVAALAAGCVFVFPAGYAGAAGAPERPPRANSFGAPISWAACDPPVQDLQCARIRVPLDWDRPRGRTIRLALIRHLASKPSERIGTLLINPGGPGDTGVGLVAGDPEGVDAIGGGRFDVVSWDPRGAHASTRLRCFGSRRSEQRFWAGVTVPTTIAEAKRTLRRGAALARRCGKVSGWLLPHISTADTARDMDHLRELVGEEKLTYVGLSYGTYLGQTYANMFPNRVRAMLLNGIVNAVRYSKSAEARLAMFSDAADEVFGQFLSLCASAGPERCALAGGARSPAEKWQRLLARVKRRPIPAPAANGTGLSRAELTYGDLLFSQFAPMRAPRTWPQNAADLDAALRGDASALEDAAIQYTSPEGWGGGSTSAAIQCADAPNRKGPRAGPQVFKRLNRAGFLQGPLHFAWEWAPCASWPVRAEDNYRGPWNVSTPNPILLINERYDPNSGYGNAVSAERYLGNAVLLTHEGYGHLFFQNPSACVNTAMVDYLTELITPPRGTVCQSDQQPFDPDFGSP
jgi:pimeloyl-ACP methyl ester carboxylesterase